MRAFLIAILALVLSSCATIPSPYVRKSTVEKQMDAMRVEFAAKLEEATKAVEVKKDEVAAAKDAQIQAAANSYYGQSLVFRSLIEPTRTDLILMNLAEEGWLAIGHILPDYPTMMAINERIATELDAAKTSLADLKKSHAVVMAQNQKLVDATLAKEAELAALAKAKSDLEAAHAKAVAEKQAELNAANNDIIAKKTADLESKKARDAQLAKLSWGAGILAVLCLAGAIFSPLFKKQLGILAAVMGGAAVCIPFLETWMVLAGAGTAITGVILWMILSGRKTEKTLETEKAVSTDLIRGLQRVKEKAPEAWENAVKPEIVEANLKYETTKDGVVTKVEDPARQAFIDQRLAEVGDK